MTVSSHDKIKKEAQTWVLRKMSLDMTADEQHRFDLWFHQSMDHQKSYEEIKSLWASVGDLESDFLADRETDGYEPSNAKLVSTTHLQRDTWFTNGIWQYAAMFMLVVSVSYYLFSHDLMIRYYADEITAAGEQKHISLPDGSKVMLNTASAISLDFTDKVRRIHLLEGEIYVDVKPDKSKPFIIQTAYNSATALGTSFSVSKDDDVFEVTVREGKVAVKTKINEFKTIAHLQANQAIELIDTTISKPLHEVNALSELSWRNGNIIFKNAEFQRAIQELDRYFPGKIFITNTPRNLSYIDGVFDKNNILDAIRAVAATQGLAMSISPGELFIVLH